MFDEPLLRDHKIFGEQVLMGVAHLSLAIDHARQFLGRGAVVLERGMFSNALVVKPGQSSIVTVKEERAGDKVSLTTRYPSDAGEKQAATFVLGAASEWAGERLDIQATIASARERTSGDIFYKHSRQESYGPSLANVRTVHRLADGAVLGELSITEQMRARLPEYYIHPCVFDACHVVSTFSLGNEPIDDHRVPLMIKRVRVSNQITADALSTSYCHVKRVMKNEQIAEMHVKLFDRDGELLFALEGFTTKKVPSREALFSGGGESKEPRSTDAVVARSPAVEVEGRREVNAASLEKSIQDYLREKIGRVINKPRNEIPVQLNFMDMGVDSSSMIGAVREIEKEVGIELYPTLFFEHQNIAALSKHFATENAEAFSRLWASAPSAKKESAEAPGAWDDASLEKAIQTYLREKLARVLGKPKHEVPLTTNFMDLGVESSSMIGTVQEIEKEVGIELYPTLLFEHQNITALAKHFAESGGARFKSYFQASGRGVASAAPARSSDGVRSHTVSVTEPPAPSRNEVLPASNEIAIIGMSGYLAQSENLSEFWHHLERADDLIEEIPASHWDHRPWFDTERNAVNKTYSKWGSFLKDVDKFDPVFFGISPRLAEWMDPQLRMLLQSVQETMEDAGAIRSIIGSKTGVYVGCCFQEYWDEIVRSHVSMVDYQAHSSAMSSLSGTVSYMFDLQGGSIPLDNACASSLTALHLACQALRNGECDQALVAGVNALLSPLHYVYFSRLQALSPTGHCHSFDKKADGYVPGEGVVSVLLKPLAAAIRDGDRIHAVIKGTAINHVGRSNNPYAPRPELQTKLLREAWKNAGINPEDLSYIEAHGTGTPLGDPIEINALKAAMKPYTSKTGFCAIGSTKAHIGHLEGAAGLASLIKVVLMLKNRKIPRMPNFEALNPYIRLDDSPFFINTELMDWERRDGKPRLAGVSSFGMTGNNSHVVLEEYVAPETEARRRTLELSNSPVLITLSAKNEDRLRAYAQKLLAFVESSQGLNLTDVSYTLQVGRQAMSQRAAFVVRDVAELKAKLARLARGEATPDSCFQGRARDEVESTEFFPSESEFVESVTRWVKAGQLEKIAELWIKGLDIDWRLLHAGLEPRKISLPTYPFSKERYWFSAPAVALQDPGVVREPAPARAPRHPLVQEDVSDSEQPRFRSVFDGQEFFLSDHRVQQGRVLPGVAYLEMARAAASIAGRKDILAIENVVWSRPIEVGDTPKEVTIRLTPQGRELRYEISSAPGAGARDAERAVHSQGKIVTGTRPATEKRRIEISAIENRCLFTIEAARIYEKFREQGLNYGAAFQAVAKISIGRDEALATVRLPASRSSDVAGFGLDPSIMDAALQATIGLTMSRGLFDSPSRPQLPFAIGSVELHGPTPKSGYAYVRYSPGTKPGDSVQKHDIDVVDADGNVCVAIKGFVTRALEVPREQAEAKRPVTPEPPSRGELAARNVSVAEARTRDGAGRKTLDKQRLGEATERFLVGCVCDILKLKAEDISPDEEMSAYGLDSITLTELANRTSRELDIELAPTIFFEHPTLASFRDFLLETHEREVAARFGDPDEGPDDSGGGPGSGGPGGGGRPEQRLVVDEAPREVTGVVTPRHSGVERFASSSREDDDIAIIGVSGRFPMAKNLDAFWANLRDGRDCISEIPRDRWDWKAIHGDPSKERNKSNVKWGGFIDGIDRFDPLFFGISPREAEVMDPQQRLLMQHVWLAIEDAGYSPKALSGSATGLFVGTASTGYQQRVMDTSVSIEGHTATAVVASVGPNRLSYLLNLHGPSEPIETACSSSLVAIHRGVQALKNGECDQVLAGGVNTLLSPEVHISFNKAGMLCEDGRCKTFSKSANGYVRGEGAGIVFLKRLRDAKRDNDHIYAVIKATSENHGGRGQSLTAPNANAQAELIKDAYRKAGIDPRTVTYIETHGTGTPLGDPVEINGLKKSFQALYEEWGVQPTGKHCGLGSVKSNIGHLELAAGIAGVMKVLLAMKHGELPRSLHCDDVNPYIKLDDSPFYLVQKRQPWERLTDEDGSTLPRRAGVSSFGFGGVNAHVVLEEYVEEAGHQHTRRLHDESWPAVVPLSAKSEERLRVYAQELLAFVEKAGCSLEELAYTLQVGREPMEYRLAIQAGELRELRDALAGFVSGRAMENWYSGHVTEVPKSSAAPWMEQKDARKLAEHWVRGGAVDWAVLYGEEKPRRLSLPTYPFAEERYWVPEATGVVVTARPSKLHPLLGENTSDLRAQQFTSVFTGEEFFLEDHQVRGQRVLPAVGYLEMARAAGAVAGGSQVASLKDVVWAQPVVVNGQSRSVTIRLRPETDTAVGFEVRSGSEEQLHSQGRLVLNGADGQGARQARRVDLTGVKGRCDSVLAKEELYRGLRQQGLEYGATFQTIQELRFNGTEALASIQLPEDISGEAEQYVLHPSVMDAALQTSAGLGMGEGGAWLPFAVEAVEVFQRTPARSHAYARRSSGKGERGIARYDIDLVSEAGEVCVAIQGLTLRKAAEPRPEGGRKNEVLYATSQWKESRLEASAASSGEAEAVVLLAGGEERVRAGLEAALDVRVEAVPGFAGAEQSEETEGTFRWVFQRVKELLQGRPKRTQKVVVVVPWDEQWFRYAPVAGLLKTAGWENPKLQGRLVAVAGLERADTERLRQLIEQELGAAAGAVEVRYGEDGRREERQLVEVGPGAQVEELGQYVKPGGVYWITGGMGGLGLHFARHLGQTKGVKVVLSGRSALDETKTAALEELRRQQPHATFTYVAVDLGDRGAVAGAVEKLRAEYGGVKGVIHSAGVIQDAYVVKKEEGQIEAVFAPKVKGLLNLEEATREEELDFVVLFSSLAGAMGSAGQADYAGANAFLDAYAEYRQGQVKEGKRKGRTVSVGWPLWKEGGMRMEEQAREAMERTSGMVPMETEIGLRAFDVAMGLPYSHLVVVQGDIGRVRPILVSGAADAAVDDVRPQASIAAEAVTEDIRSEESLPANPSRVTVGAGFEETLKEKTLEHLKKQLSQVLKLPSHRIDEKAPLEKYGIDSLMVMNLSNELEKVFGPLSKTLFFEFQTLEQLGSYFVENHREKLVSLLGISATVNAQPVPPPVKSEAAGLSRPRRFSEPETKAPAVQRGGALDIAIIGVSGRYPQARDLAAFWDNLKAGRDCVTEVPRERWDYRPYFDLDKSKSGKIHGKWGGFIDDVDKFDPLFFNISPREAEVMDPQERLFLQCAWEAMEDAGYTRERLADSASAPQKNVGVYVGVMYEEYQFYGVQELLKGNPLGLTGNPSGIANRVSYFCNFHGPSMAVDTMCSSSLTTIHLACQSLRQGQCRMAIAGGVNVSIHPNKYILLSQGKFISTHGKCESFGRGGDGYVPGEGVGCVVLKPLEDAVRDGDHIYGVIKATAINHGGKTNGYTVPNPQAQTAVIRQALEQAQVDVRTLSYVEAHGTGTSLGDPIEISGLTKAYEGRGEGGPLCAIGSVKSNIGHCESAAGVAGVTKVLLQLKYGQLVPSIHSQELNPNIDFTKTPFRVQRELGEWKRPVVEGRERPRVAGISSFGAGGSNAHVIIEEYIEQRPERAEEEEDGRPQLVVLSARNEERLRAYARRMLDFVKRAEYRLEELAYTLQVGREAMEHRVAFLVREPLELEARLAAFASGERDIEDCFQGRVNENKDGVMSLGSDGDFKELINTWAAKGKLAKLAELWARGMAVDWTLLYGEQKPRRLSLPTYPFAEERYWVPQTTGTLVTARPSKLHPLLGENTSDLWDQQFTSVFTGEEFFLEDHRVRGQRVLPAVGYLEMARAAGAVAGRSQVLSLKDLVWAQPVVVNGKAQEVTIRLYPETDTEVGFEVRSGASGEGDAQLEEQLHSQGRLVLGEGAEGEGVRQARRVDLTGVKGRCDSVLAKEEFYRGLRQQGLEYGATFQTIQELRFNGTEALASIQLPEDISGEAEQYVLHPSVMDAALQTSAGLGMGEGGAWLPFAVEAVEVFQRTPARSHAYARRSSGKGERGIARYDIDLVSEAGEVCVAIQGLTLRKAAEPRPEGGRKNEVLYATSQWKESRLEASAASSGEAEAVVLLAGGEERVRAGLEAALDVRVEAVPGFAGAEQSEETEGTFRWVFQRVKELLQGRPKRTQKVVVVVPWDEQWFRYAPVAGLLKTAGWENPKLQGRLVAVAGLERADTERLRQLIEQELGAAAGAVEVRYGEDGRREERQLVEVGPGAQVEELGQYVKPGGVYWITGGMGGLGLHFARHLGQTKGVKVVLSGRSALDETKTAALEELRRQQPHATFTYVAVDLGDRGAVAGAVEKLRAEYGGVKGVIHSAGVIQDAYVVKKEEGQIEAVFAPKVKGLLNLEEATREEELDFVVLFSSLAGAMGSAGQADYAGANAFLDAYAEYRQGQVREGKRKGRTVSVGWPLWREGGMRMEEQAREAMERTSGMVPMETEIGLRAFDVAMALPHPHLIAVQGELSRLQETLLSSASSAAAVEDVRIEEPVPVTPPPTTEVAGAEDMLKEKTIEYLKRQLSQVLKLPSHRIDEKAPLEKYGIDSVMVMSLSNELEKVFGPLSKTLFFEFQTLDELGSYFVESYREKLMSLLGIGATANAQPVAPVVKKREPVGLSRQAGRPRRRLGGLAAKTPEVQRGGALDIAIIGVSGRYPQARDLAAFWDNLKAGRDCVTEVPRERWDYRPYFDLDKSKEGKIHGKWGGFIDDVDKFDPLFFNISPREAEVMDPQERLFLQCAWEAMEDAGYTRERLADSASAPQKNVGVYVGVMYEEYQFYGVQELLKGNPLGLTGNPSGIANRVSYFCNFHGPSMAVDTMCSSSLTTIHLACQSLRQGQCRMAIAGGVNVSIHPNKYILLSQGKFISTHGKCESFGRGGDGYVPGEGVGCVVLKPLEDAVRDGDHIYGVIKATAINHGGKTNGYTVPNPQAQTAVIRQALEQAQVDVRTLSYVEAHGTGTSLGDPIEISGLTKAYEGRGEGGPLCAIGSVKSNIGHCESAAGVAGVTKVLLQLKYGQLVPSIHSQELNPNIDFTKTPFRVQRELGEWKRPVVEGRERPRVAGISSFGAGGSNAHVIIEEYIEQRPERAEEEDGRPQLVVLSARNEERLRAYARKVLDFLRRSEASDEGAALELGDVAYTLQTGREALKHRLAMVVHDMRQLKERLAAFVAGETEIENCYLGQTGDEKGSIDLLSSDADLKQGIQRWIEKGKLEKLAELWVRGLVIDWDQLHQEHVRRRVSLPTYPFAQDRYWVPVSREDAQPTVSVPVPVQVPVPERLPIAEEQPALFLAEGWLLSPLPTQGVDWLERIRHQKGKRVLIVHDARDDYRAARRVFRQIDEALQGSDCATPFSVASLALRNGRVVEWSAEGSSPGFSPDSELGDVFRVLRDNDALPDLVLFFCAEESVRSFVSLATSLLRVAWDRDVRGYLVHATMPSDPRQEFESIPGLARAVSTENPRHVYTTIAIDGVMGEGDKVSLVLNEWLLADGGGSDDEAGASRSIRYQDGKRWRAVSEKIDVPPLEEGHGLEKGGTYLVTHGTSALGLSLEKYLLDRFQATLIVLGEGGDASADGALARLARETAPGRVIYEQVDLSDRTALARVMEEVRARTGPIHGVFHLGADSHAGDEESRAYRVLNKAWRPKAIVSHSRSPATGTVLVLVNAQSAKLVTDALSSWSTGEVVLVSSERLDDARARYFDFRNGALAQEPVAELLRTHPEISSVIDLSDLYAEDRSADDDKLGKLHLFQKLVGAFSDISILHFTKGLQRFGSQTMSLAGAKFSGLVKMLSSEYKHVTAKCVDIDAHAYDGSKLREIAERELSVPLEETEIVYRRGERFAPHLQARELPDASGGRATEAAFTVRRDGVYVVTGGTNGIGLEVAKLLARRGASKLVLMGVTPLPPKERWTHLVHDSSTPEYVRRKLEAFLELEGRGVSVTLYTGPLDDRARLGAFFGDIRRELGAIRGVVHSAGAMQAAKGDEFAFVRKSLKRMEEVFAPKIAGLDTLSSLLSADDLDFFVSFSSTAGQLPGFMRGMSDYGIANAYVDSFTEFQAHGGKPCFRSMAWVGWADTGSHSRDSSAHGIPEANARQQGLLFNDTSEGLDLFERGLLVDTASASSLLPCVMDPGTFEAKKEQLLFARSEPDGRGTQKALSAMGELRSRARQALGAAERIVNLDEVLRREPLAFFVLATPTPDSFQSAFARWRTASVQEGTRQGKTLHVTLGLQGEVTTASARASSTEGGVHALVRSVGAAATVLSALPVRAEDQAKAPSHAPMIRMEQRSEHGSNGHARNHVAFNRLLERLAREGRQAADELLLELDVDALEDGQVQQLSALLFGAPVDRYVGPVAPRPETAPPPVRSESPRVQQEPPRTRQEPLRAPQGDADLKSLVMTELAKVLKIDRSSIDENESFQDYGLDSITGTQLATRMEKVVGIEISPAWLIEFSTIEALAKKILLEKQNQGQG
nr:hypothetical protein [Archangium gephyra]